MPPKQKPKLKKEKEKSVAPDPCPQFQLSETSLQDKEMDLAEDLNDDFFSAGNRTIQMLMEGNRIYEASKIKKFLDIIFHLHHKYAEELKETSLLRPQINRAENKLRLALEVTAHSEEAMERLRDAVAKAWTETDASLRREQEAQHRFQEVYVKYESLLLKEEKKQDDEAEKARKLFGHLGKYKNMILRERDRLNMEVDDLDQRLQFQRFYSESLEFMHKSQEEQISKLHLRVKILESEKSNFEVKIRNLTNNLEEQKDINIRNLGKLDAVRTELALTQEKLVDKTSDFETLKKTLEKLREDNVANIRQITLHEDEISHLHKHQKENEEALKLLRLEDKVKGNMIYQLTQKYRKALQDHNLLSSKLYKLNRANHNLGEDIVRFKNQINSLEKDLASSGYKFEDLRRIKENIQHERDALRSDILKLNNTIADLRHTIIIHGNTIDGLNFDIKKLTAKLEEAKTNVSKAEGERDEMAQELATLNERNESLQEQIEMKTNQIIDFTEKLNRQHLQLINVKKQLESAHSEKMALKRSLDTCTQERDNFRVMQSKSNHQIAQLTAEITANQHKINHLNMQIERLNTEKKELQTELQKKENLLTSVRKDLRDLKNKNESLLKTIYADELKFMKITQNLEDARKEKNLIGLQMVRRNDEIVVLKDKLCISQTALDHGQSQYNQRVQDIKLLKVEIKNLQTERECQTRALKSTADMRKEITSLQRALNQERVRVRSLMEDAKTPTGVHRWRILKGRDPERFELLEKVQLLQSRNLKHEQEKEKLREKLEESDRVCQSLKRVVDNLPTSDLKQKLVVAQRLNRVQEKKLKVLNAELSVTQVELQMRECAIHKLKEALKKKQQTYKGVQPSSSALSSELAEYADVSQENTAERIRSVFKKEDVGEEEVFELELIY